MKPQTYAQQRARSFTLKELREMREAMVILHMKEGEFWKLIRRER